MSHSKTLVSIPTHLLKHFDVDLSSNKTTVSRIKIRNLSQEEILDFIETFRPDIQIDSPEKENRLFLIEVFIEMVAPRLLELNGQDLSGALYIQASLRSPSHLRPAAHPKILTSKDKISQRREFDFELYVASLLASGRYYELVSGISRFVKEHNFLNHHELSEINATKEFVEGQLLNTFHDLQRSQESVESIKILLCQSQISKTERESLEAQRDGAKVNLEFCKASFDRTLDSVGFLGALMLHHEAILEKLEHQAQAEALTDPDKTSS